MSKSDSNTATHLATVIRQFGGDPVADLPFWKGCREGRFLLHRCAVCARHYWPATRCLDHGNQGMQWVESTGVGMLYTYTVLHKAYTPAMKDKVPYVVGVIKLDEGPFFHSNVLGCSTEEVKIGMALRAEMLEHESGLIVPMFYPAGA